MKAHSLLPHLRGMSYHIHSKYLFILICGCQRMQMLNSLCNVLAAVAPPGQRRPPLSSARRTCTPMLSQILLQRKATTVYSLTPRKLP